MSERRKIGEKEKLLLPVIADYVKKKGLDKEEGLAIALLCNTDKKSDIMLEFLKENPDVEFDELLGKAVKIYQEQI